MTKYTFDFSKMTIGDIATLKSGDEERALAVVDRLAADGILHLPIEEYQSVMEQFGKACSAYMEERMARHNTQEADDAAVRVMLKGIKGLGA